MVEIKRVKTNIPGFDRLVQGGFPENSVVLICGTPGTAKTIFGLQYIYNGAAIFKEKGLYISFEQSEDSLKSQASMFGWDFDKLVKKNLVKIKYIPVTELSPKTIDYIEKEVKTKKYKRLVIDSVSTLAINAPIYTSIEDISLVDIVRKKSFFSPPIVGDFITRRFIYHFIDRLHKLNCTTLLISEASEKGEYLSRDTISEFVCDGVILMTFESMGGKYSRSLMVRKMRNTKNDEDIHPVEITSKGLKIHRLE